MAELVSTKIENLIIDTLRDRSSPIEEKELISQIVKKFGNGDISDAIKNAIERLEHGRHILIRDLQNRLEYSPPKRYK